MLVARSGSLAVALCLHACTPVILDVSGMEADAEAGAEAGETIPAGSTVVVVLINPVVNEGHAGGTPGELGQVRDAVAIDPEPGGAAATVDGLAVAEVVAGSLVLRVGDATLSLDVPAEADLIDAPIAFDGEKAAYFSNTPIRHPTAAAVRLTADVPAEDLAGSLAEDGAVVVLRAGVYPGDLVIAGDDVLLLGEGWTDAAAVIDGSVVVEGDRVRLRGLTIHGDLSARGDKIGVSFTRVLGVADLRSAGATFIRDVFCGGVSTTPKGAMLLENYGIAPLLVPPEGACDL